MIDLAITADHIRTVIGDYLDAYPEERSLALDRWPLPGGHL
ncbi:hypothetical protein [Streptosporangium vulgare]|uniref:GNAT family N-acetyltransferase n=1 Tax=Streptosporangium vulgare TaxID=46190 RepID=A0ABV5TCY5_9ACTN